MAAEHVAPKRGCSTADKRTKPVGACGQVGLRNEVQREARFVRRFCKLVWIGKPVFRVVEERYDLATFPVARWKHAGTGKPTDILILVYQGARAELLENRCNQLSSKHVWIVDSIEVVIAVLKGGEDDPVGR